MRSTNISNHSVRYCRAYPDAPLGDKSGKMFESNVSCNDFPGR